MEDLRKNIRSFRFSDRVLEILEGFEGNSLNDKFNNLVLFCYDEVPKKVNHLDEIKKQIKKHQDKEYELFKKLSEINTLIRELEQIKHYGEIAVRRAKSICEADVESDDVCDDV